MGTSTNGGLEGVVVADTRLSDVDGAQGRLVIAGHDVEALAGTASFERACGLLWGAARPPEPSEAVVGEALARGRMAAWERLPALGDALRAADGMDALRASVAHIAVDERGDAVTRWGRLAGAVAVFAAAWGRTRAGAAPVAPEGARGHAEDYLRMLRGGAAVDGAQARALDAYLVTVSDHGMNASTFAARVVASTGSDTGSAVVAALGALKGPLHGGAPGPVLDMLDAVGAPGRAESWLEGEMAAGRRVMGMGHRIYRVRDPRAAVLERAIEALESAGVSTGRLVLARAVERTAERVLQARHPDRQLRANVEFYTAVLLDTLGLDRGMFTPTFAVGRVAGWCAHVGEQQATGRLIRPASRYVGPMPAAAVATAG